MVKTGGGGEQCGNKEIEAIIAGRREFGCVCVCVLERERERED